MKRICGFLVLLVSMVTVVHAQQLSVDKVSVPVRSAFAKLHPKTTKVGWVMEKQGNVHYEAEVEGKDLLFDVSGNPIK